MCILFHKWEKWGAPYTQKIFLVDEVGFRLGSELRQRRFCIICGKMVVRKAR